jgi:hypothetical protein
VETGADGNVEMDDPPFVLVLSRPCNALRATQVVVAAVRARDLGSDGIKDAKTLADIRDFFEGVRDGFSAPDRLYLGALTTDPSKRFFAHLDSHHTIQLPKDVEARSTFVEKRRVFHLEDAFVRDLHLRIYNAFASLGFEDEAWLSDEDLSIVVALARAELSRLRADHDGLAAALAASQVAGVKEKQIAQQRQEQEAASKRLIEVEARAQRFFDEAARRPKLAPTDPESG